MKRVLIVEDNHLFAQLIGRKIELQLGFEYKIAPTLEQVKKLFNGKKNNFFAAILDLNLPDAKNEKIVNYVLRHKIPSVVFTGDFDTKVREKILSKNIVDYVVKENIQDVDYVIRTIHRIFKNQFIKVMVVEDDNIQRKYIVRLLKIHQYNVLEAGNGREALELLDENPDVKLVITDYKMPQMDGFDLISRIRKRFAMDQLAVIGISADGSGLVSAKFLKKGANDFIYKPFVNEEFFCRINQNIEMLEYIQAVKESSNKDYLTGLSNRRHFFDVGETLFKNAQRGGVKLTVAMIDIDNFKNVNDTYGHETGDIALKHISKILYENLRKADLIARIGGEEFCVMNTNMNKTKARVTYERIRKLVGKTRIHSHSDELKLTVSIGVTNQIFDTLDASLNYADKLLYKAKQAGKNRVVID